MMLRDLKAALSVSVALIAGGHCEAVAQETPDRTIPWGPLALLEGTWQAQIDGMFGTGVGVRRYEFVLGGHFLMQRHASVRMPQEKSPEGDYHREFTVFSYDRHRETIVHREFFQEGIVSQFTCETQPERVTCISESIENGPGLRARLELFIDNAYSFREEFEVTNSAGKRIVYFNNRWTRAPSLEDFPNRR